MAAGGAATLRVCTYNIHKGFSFFNRRMVIHELREGLRSLGSDIVFLQEVQGEHAGHRQRAYNWPVVPQHEFLGEERWCEVAYAHNAVYTEGHHGNAILSRYPIRNTHNQDVSDHRFEKRGLLHSRIEVPGLDRGVHCVCVHLGLFEGSRRRQIAALTEYLEREVPADAPLVIAGDFNDWRKRADTYLAGRLDVQEVFSNGHRKAARSFPARLPLLHLDRIYVRRFRIVTAQIHGGQRWSRMSDHAPLTAELEYVP